MRLLPRPPTETVMRPALGLPTRTLLALAALGVASLAIASCTQDFDEFFQGPVGVAGSGGSGLSGGGGSGGGGTGGTGLSGGGGSGGTGLTGGGGSGGGCASPDQCPGVDTTCSFRTCDGGQCGMDIAPVGTSCSESGGQVCDDSGACVQCNSEAECQPQSCAGSTLYSQELCSASGTCSPPMVSSCAPYVCNGGGTDCLSTCQDHGDCTPGNYCDGSNHCSPKEGTGFACGGDDEVCQNGNCVDGFCCDSACTNPCLACSAALTGGSDGTCAPALAGCSCEAQYSGAAGYFETCTESATECGLRVSTSGQSCETICESAGGECLAFNNDSPNGTCGIGQALNCWDQGPASAICTCSRGCGGNEMCVSPDTCIGGTCQ